MTLVDELSTLVTCLDSITTGIAGTDIKLLKDTYRTQAEDYVNNIIRLSTKIKLTRIENEKIYWEPSGKEYAEASSYTEQKRIDFLRSKFFAEEQFPDEFKNMMKVFKTRNHEGKPILTCVLRKNHSFDKIIIAYLEEIRIFESIEEKTGHEIGIRINCVDQVVLTKISKIQNEVEGPDEEEFEEKLKGWKMLGNEGEKYAMKFEEERLGQKEGMLDLAFDVKQISLTDVYAGFDIKSYDGSKSKLMEHDRMIEVKTTTNSKPRFYWSSGEVEKAKREREKYWIYLWIKVKSIKQGDDIIGYDFKDAELIRYPNPYKTFFEDMTEKPRCKKYLLDSDFIEKSNP